jgi:hypothetical protein
MQRHLVRRGIGDEHRDGVWVTTFYHRVALCSAGLKVGRTALEHSLDSLEVILPGCSPDHVLNADAARSPGSVLAHRTEDQRRATCLG